jgi:membrane associated rhomboid family serine protease
MDKLDFEAKKTPVTSAIIALNILVFITLYSTEQLNPLTPKGTEVFHQWGANFITLTVEQPWRLFTCAWLHFGLLHIACNMYFLHALGRLSEKLIGPKFYLIIYIFSAFTGSLASLIWNEDPVTSLGASGAVFGVVGMIGAFLLTRKNEVPSMAFRNLKNNMIQIVVLNFLIGVSISAIDNAAHIGGLVGGFIGASIMSRSLNEEKRKKAFLPKLILGLIILPAIVIGIWKSGLIQSKPALVYQKVASTLDNKQEEKINEVQKLIKSYLRKELDKAVFVARISEIQSFWTQQFNDINSVSFSQDSRVYPSVLRINSVSEYRINKLQIALDFADQPELMQREIIKLKNNWKTEIY